MSNPNLAPSAHTRAALSTVGGSDDDADAAFSETAGWSSVGGEDSIIPIGAAATDAGAAADTGASLGDASPGATADAELTPGEMPLGASAALPRLDALTIVAIPGSSASPRADPFPDGATAAIPPAMAPVIDNDRALPLLSTVAMSPPLVAADDGGGVGVYPDPPLVAADDDGGGVGVVPLGVDPDPPLGDDLDSPLDNDPDPCDESISQGAAMTIVASAAVIFAFTSADRLSRCEMKVLHSARRSEMESMRRFDDSMGATERCRGNCGWLLALARLLAVSLSNAGCGPTSAEAKAATAEGAVAPVAEIRMLSGVAVAPAVEATAVAPAGIRMLSGVGDVYCASPPSGSWSCP